MNKDDTRFSQLDDCNSNTLQTASRSSESNSHHYIPQKKGILHQWAARTLLEKGNSEAVEMLLLLQ